MVPPSFLKLTPKDLYDQIREISQVKYGHELPEEPRMIGCLASASYKTALLRDLCKALGIQLNLSESKRLLLGNKIKPLLACHNELA